MKKYIILMLLGGFLLISHKYIAQNNKAELISIIKKNKNDSSGVNALNDLAAKNIFSNGDTALILANQALNMAKSMSYNGKLGWQKGIAKAHHVLGSINFSKGNYDEALKQYHQALNIREKLNDKAGMAKSIVNIGTSYREKGEQANALKYYYKALSINESINDKNGIEINTGIIGSALTVEKQYDKALTYYFRALKMAQELGNRSHEGDWMGSIGMIYDKKRDFTKTMEYFEKAIAISEELGEQNSIAVWKDNMATTYRSMKKMDKALEYYFISLKINEKLGKKKNTANQMINIGAVYMDLKKYTLAKNYMDKALAIFKESGAKLKLREGYYFRMQLDSMTNNYKEAFKDYKLFILYKDSVDNEETRKQSMQTVMQYEYDKKEAVANAEHKTELVKQNLIAEEQNRKKNTIISSVIIGLVLVIVFAVFMYSRYKVTQKQKGIIELKEKETRDQKHIIEEKHREITDSINYAERIQRSLLASKEMLDTHLKDYFIYFKPKDIVSGDFYWAAQIAGSVNQKQGLENLQRFCLVTADSTGHGVPGAIMSILNISALKEVVKEGIVDPSLILNKTRSLIIDTLKKDGSKEGGKDGMDCSLCVFDFIDKKLFVAAANNPVWIVRNNGNDTSGGSQKLIEIKPDKIPVGRHDKQNVQFTLHEIQLEKGDVVYTLTDGFSDQFGGEKGKKFMSKNLRELLAASAHLPMLQQKELLETTFKNWVGSLEQIDDVTIIGVRV